MNIFNIRSLDQIEAVAKLGAEIWEDHYTPIIGKEQVSYMLDKFQSVHAVQTQIESENYHYFGLEESGLVGYLAVQKRAEAMFLSKFYIHKSERGKGFAKLALKFVEDFALKNECTEISLTVNKYNSGSIKAYEKMGFKSVDEVVADIGQGYVMDDYIMKKLIK
ncbi:GNAT family N-acetyltransferase [Sediminitomix flava]|uniref:Acetyltransferase (GNAT) family protein n=1 Tax=Sediminitomix flava TaxID=379075 RepID=A0A315ZJ14_SEDFL|nr:GNAT family N-acetyltransferase [Sediminitomix flava]PWJ45080.1 acetyltransferase (GNAT) family protein [Sediminitomix flava]